MRQRRVCLAGLRPQLQAVQQSLPDSLAVLSRLQKILLEANPLTTVQAVVQKRDHATKTHSGQYRMLNAEPSLSHTHTRTHPLTHTLSRRVCPIRWRCCRGCSTSC